MEFFLLALSLDFSALCAVAACLVVFALVYSDWSGKRRARKWNEAARDPEANRVPALRAGQAGRIRMTAKLVALGALCAAGAIWLRNDSVEVKAKGTPASAVETVEAVSSTIDLPDESAFDFITLTLSAADTADAYQVELGEVSTWADAPPALSDSAVEFLAIHPESGPAVSDEYRRRANGRVPRAVDPASENVFDKLGLPR